MPSARNLELAGVDAEARERAARAESAQRALERLLRSEHFDVHVHVHVASQAPDFGRLRVAGHHK